jgi:hypothetical protein
MQATMAQKWQESHSKKIHINGKINTIMEKIKIKYNVEWALCGD